ncbi:7745_t:CDS:2, partial [Racocetra fulgida]
MGSYDDYYMNPKFDPQKVTIAQLREILDAHNVHYTSGEKKADLIRIFNKHVRPLIPSLREKKTRASKIKNDPLKTDSEIKETDSEIKETDSEIKETEMTILSTYNLEYISVKEYFHQGLPNRTILGILKLKMPTELVKAHETYKSQNFLNRTHRMFHGTKSLCNPQRFIENPQAKFCKKGCGVCGIAQE